MKFGDILRFGNEVELGKKIMGIILSNTMYSEQVDHDKNEYLTKKNHFSS
jgi:hypothetical protein